MPLCRFLPTVTEAGSDHTEQRLPGRARWWLISCLLPLETGKKSVQQGSIKANYWERILKLHRKPTPTHQMSLIMVLFKAEITGVGCCFCAPQELQRHLALSLAEQGYWGYERGHAGAATADKQQGVCFLVSPPNYKSLSLGCIWGFRSGIFSPGRSPRRVTHQLT